MQVVHHVAREQGAEHHQARHPTANADAGDPDVVVGQGVAPALPTVLPRVQHQILGDDDRLAQRAPQQPSDEQARRRQQHEHIAPIDHDQQLRDQDRRNRKAEERHRGLHDAHVAADMLRRRALEVRHHRRRGEGAVEQADDTAQEHQGQQAGREAADPDDQGEAQNGQHGHAALPEPIGQVADEDRGASPGDRQRPGDQADILVVEMQRRGQDREHRQDHEPVEPDQAEAEREQDQDRAGVRRPGSGQGGRHVAGGRADHGMTTKLLKPPSRRSCSSLIALLRSDRGKRTCLRTERSSWPDPAMSATCCPSSVVNQLLPSKPI